jgi:hypothetical protein
MPATVDVTDDAEREPDAASDAEKTVVPLNYEEMGAPQPDFFISRLERAGGGGRASSEKKTERSTLQSAVQ